MLDGVLRGDNEKRLRKGESLAVNGELRFVHGFEKCGLRARGGAINFVGKDHVGENRAGTEFKFAGFGIVDADAQHVARQKIRRELDALEAAMKRFCKRLGERGLTDTRNVFDE